MSEDQSGPEEPRPSEKGALEEAEAARRKALDEGFLGRKPGESEEDYLIRIEAEGLPGREPGETADDVLKKLEGEAAQMREERVRRRRPGGW